MGKITNFATGLAGAQAPGHSRALRAFSVTLQKAMAALVIATAATAATSTVKNTARVLRFALQATAFDQVVERRALTLSGIVQHCIF